ncbi:MAG: tRNA (N6-threonylcarbamoyladenosine(37)-N6)-methyltransferase TrmO [Candidatus Ornithomonoglobus sp.]
MTREMKIIAHIKSDFPEKFGIPRQSGLADTQALIIFEPEYRVKDAVRGLNGFSHIWLIWEFSESVRDSWSPMVHPPRLGGNTQMGVFATRSPFRPNPVGLSSVKLDRIEHDPALGPVLHISGADLKDGTPIYDIKPYLPYTDSRADAKGGFADSFADYRLEVVFPPELIKEIPESKRRAAIQVLEQDPRPSYQNDPERIYGTSFAGKNIRFRVADNVLTVCGVEDYEEYLKQRHMPSEEKKVSWNI